MCLIDGDGYIFQFAKLAQGRFGGLQCAQLLAETIHEWVHQQISVEQSQLHVSLFVNKRGLYETLKRCNESAAADGLEAFLLGFNQAAERFIAVDVGDGKEVVDCKMRGQSTRGIDRPVDF